MAVIGLGTFFRPFFYRTICKSIKLAILDINTKNEEELSYMILTSSDKTALTNFAAEQKYFNLFPISGEFFWSSIKKFLTIQLFLIIKQNLNDGLCSEFYLDG